VISWLEFWRVAREDPELKRRVLDNIAVMVACLACVILAVGILVAVVTSGHGR
jgi:hypothetical protein